MHQKDRSAAWHRDTVVHMLAPSNGDDGRSIVERIGARWLEIACTQWDERDRGEHGEQTDNRREPRRFITRHHTRPTL